MCYLREWPYIATLNSTHREERITSWWELNPRPQLSNCSIFHESNKDMIYIGTMRQDTFSLLLQQHVVNGDSSEAAPMTSSSMTNLTITIHVSHSLFLTCSYSSAWASILIDYPIRSCPSSLFVRGSVQWSCQNLYLHRTRKLHLKLKPWCDDYKSKEPILTIFICSSQFHDSLQSSKTH